MRIEFKWDRNALTRLMTTVWLLFKNDKEKRTVKQGDVIPVELITRNNIAIMALIFTWAGLYFTFQFHFEETPRYFSGPLFTVAPTLFLQQYRNVIFDYFCSYFYVYGMLGMYLVFWGLALGSEKDMWKFALGFLVCWIAQGTLQLAIGAASPVRVPGLGVDFIRYEIFPLSEATMGIKYGAIPSGHIGAPIILFLTARLRRIKWAEWVAVGFFLTFAFVLLYLGEHYVIDMVVSLILYPILFLGVWKLSNRRGG